MVFEVSAWKREARPLNGGHPLHPPDRPYKGIGVILLPAHCSGGSLHRGCGTACVPILMPTKQFGIRQRSQFGHFPPKWIANHRGGSGGFYLLTFFKYFCHEA